MKLNNKFILDANQLVSGQLVPIHNRVKKLLIPKRNGGRRVPLLKRETVEIVLKESEGEHTTALSRH